MTYYMVETKNTHIPMWFDFMQGTWVANCLATKFADRESAERMAATLHPRDYIITEHMSGDIMELPNEKDWPEGVLTFEEIKHYLHEEEGFGCVNSSLQKIINTIRKGMIPAANAIQIPKESTWPNNADHIEVAYYDGYGEYILNGTIKIINRSKPQWMPKQGDVVFQNISPEQGRVAVVMEEDDNTPIGCVKIMAENTGIWYPAIDRLKPFDSTKIGLPWDQI